MPDPSVEPPFLTRWQRLVRWFASFGDVLDFGG